MLRREDLYSLEEYARIRPEFRQRVIAHKKNRVVALGEHVTLHFEDRLTMQYQIQEMLRLERIFEPERIQEELDVYNPLIPDGSNWKATLMIEFPDPEERKRRLAELLGIEQAVWLQVGDAAKISPLANEDLDRSTPEKTSSVHFLRFELSPAAKAAALAGAPIVVGIDHPRYHAEARVGENVRRSLLADLA